MGGIVQALLAGEQIVLGAMRCSLNFLRHRPRVLMYICRVSYPFTPSIRFEL